MFKNAFCYPAATVRIGKLVVTVDLRLYLREKTVRRLNRQRQAGQRLSFRSKNRLAKSMLEGPRPQPPEGIAEMVELLRAAAQQEGE